MTVQEAIEKLQAMPPDAPFLAYDEDVYGNGHWRNPSIRKTKLYKKTSGEGYGRYYQLTERNNVEAVEIS